MRFSDYDRRQLGRILIALDGYDQGKLSIEALISNIDGLISALETKDAAFKTNLREQWGELEIAYASALDKGRVPFAGRDRLSIQPALEELLRATSTYGCSEED